MHHRHLLPNEIDLLVDEETGFGLQPLREHAQSCPDCSARLAGARRVVAQLATLPVFAPRMGMADRVMSQVPVFVPWHVTARDTLAEWVPSTPVARALAASVIAVVGTLITGLTLWIATRGDLLAAFTGVVGEGARSAAARAAGDLVVALFGPQLIASVQQIGAIGIAFAAAGFLITSIATILGLRLIATSSRARS